MLKTKRIVCISIEHFCFPSLEVEHFNNILDYKV